MLALVTAPTLDAASSVAASSIRVDSALTPAALIASLAQPAPAHTKFTEVRYLAMLDTPMVLRGTLSWFGGDHLQRSVELPFSEVTDIREGEVTVQREGEPPAHFSLRRAPELEGLLGSFESLLSGNSKTMLESFAVELKGDKTHWKLVLDPRDKRLKKHVLGLVVYGAGNEARCMRMDEADGDLSITLLGTLASIKLPKSPKAAALIRECTADAAPLSKRATTKEASFQDVPTPLVIPAQAGVTETSVTQSFP